MDARPMDVGILNPLQIVIAKEVLQAIMSDLLAALAAQPTPTDPDDAFERTLRRAQYEEFQRWLDVQPTPSVPMAMYPLQLGPTFDGQLLH